MDFVPSLATFFYLIIYSFHTKGKFYEVVSKTVDNCSLRNHQGRYMMAIVAIF